MKSFFTDIGTTVEKVILWIPIQPLKRESFEGLFQKGKRAQMEKLNITIADNNPILLQQLADAIIHESYSRGIDYILVNPQDIGVIAGKVSKVHYVMENTQKEDASWHMPEDPQKEGDASWHALENPQRAGGVPRIKSVIADQLNKIGIPASLKGYRYIITAVEEVIRDETVLEGVTKVLYPGIAKKHHSTPQRVEKAIRHAIEVAWNRDSDSRLKQKFRYLMHPEKSRPTNSEFIAVLSQSIKNM